MPHGNAILSQAYQQSGTHLATASSDGYLRIWGMPSISTTEHELDWELQAVSASHKGQFVASLRSTGNSWERPPVVSVWDLNANKEIFSTAMDESHHDQIAVSATNSSGIAISSDGKYVAAVGYWSAGHVAQVWDTKSKREIFRVDGSDAIRSVSLDSTGAFLATESKGVVRIWDLRGRHRLHIAELPARVPRYNETYIAVASDGKHIAIINGTDKDSTYLQAYELKTGGQFKTLNVPGDVSHIAISHDGKLAATVHAATIQVWDVNAARMVQSINHTERITSIAFDATADFLAASTAEGIARIWRLRTGQLVYRIFHDGYLAIVGFHDSKNVRSLLTANGYVTRGQGESEPNQTNSIRLWHWEQADLIADACSKVSGFNDQELLQHIDTDHSLREICPDPKPEK